MLRDRREILIYTAGIFDGEGHVGVYARDALKRSFRLKLGITSTNGNLIGFLIEHFGGSFSQLSGEASRNLRCYQWELSFVKAGEFLEEIYPFLLIKQEQVKLAILFQSGQHVRRKTQEQIELCRWICKQMKALKKEGV